ncbi:host specificity factor TipJ family phage tail protein [Acinetobacter pittii]|uniref:host specificity factor TipJ family phage tail protein n=1 Tax=Acinetobacter pittii TaxID=48296 RepID=UPI001F05F293|nr:host specificity factor TipJ family phage tail protein [Acinetobacter pittii]MCH2020559.1 host specificity factor TipJ family phage tail protein [Acinetobacter pittii]
MSRIYIIKNSLEEHVKETVETDNILHTFLSERAKHPQAKIYKGNPCPENDISPTKADMSSVARLLEITDECTIVRYPGELASTVTWIASKLLGQAVSALVKLPKAPTNNSSMTGSSNNNLSNPENRQRIKQRVPFVLGAPKAIPDLFAPPYRYFKDGVEVEELLLCVCENPVRLSQFKTGDTPIQEIPGTSLSAYGLNQSLVGSETIFKWGDTFTEAPVIARQNDSINGQTALPPNSTRVEAGDIYFQYPNMIKANDQGTADRFNSFNINESLIISGANFGISDLSITGQVSVDPANETFAIESTQNVLDYQNYRKINVTSLLVTDPVNEQLDLAGLYDIESVTYASNVYTIHLKNPVSTNTNFSNVTEVLTSNISANLTANTANIFLDGEYVVTGVDTANKQLTLATPSGVNSDWNKLEDLQDQKTSTGNIKLRGSQDNWIGWFTIDSPKATGLLLNFQALNGIYQGSDAKFVDIYVEYQQVVSGTPTGAVFNQTIRLNGKANNRDSVGGSMWINLPFTGAVRFRARRTNDNGDAVDLSDEVKFYTAYAFRYLSKLVYDNRVLIRQRTQATRAATAVDTRQTNCIAESLVYSYRGGVKSAERIPSRNIADLCIELALHKRIGRRSLNEINTEEIYRVFDDVVDYFGSEKMAEFNYTLDNANQSFEEICRMFAGVSGCNERRLNRELYFDFEKAGRQPILLFNHRNKKALSEVRTYNFKIENNYDGVEITYVDSEAGWIEKTLKIPNDQITNPKKIDGYGIAYKEQAHIIGWRAWNKLKYQRVNCKFDCFAEGELTERGDPIIVVDDTRLPLVVFGDGSVTSGEVLVWNGLNIEVSQPCTLTAGYDYMIHLQMKSGFTDQIPISQGASEYDLVLARPPLEALVTEGEVKTVYSITVDDRQDEELFLVSTKNRNGVFENSVSATNLDERYYQNDKDIINNLI